MDSEKYLSEPEVFTPTDNSPQDLREGEVFGNDEKNHDIKYRTLSWPIVASIMTTEIVTGGTLTLPQALAVVGIVPGLIILVFCGVFALYTAFLLVDFKMNHPDIHNMGDAGVILFAPLGRKWAWFGRELLSAGTLFFAITAVGACALLGEFALATLSDFKLCNMIYCGISSIVVLLASLPRTLNWGLGWMSVVACASVVISCIVGMAGAGAEPTPNREISATRMQTFFTAFLTITNPVIAYAGHFMFFPLMSEMKKPQDAKKSAVVLQTFATAFYAIFAIVCYVYLGNDVQSPSFLSLSTKWAKAAWGLFLPNVLIAGALYNHTAAKIIFVRIFRDSHHLHSHTWISWTTWVGLIVSFNGIGFVLALGVPFFSYLGGIAAALFASWYTYGLAGVFWWHDTHFFGSHRAWRGGDKEPEARPGGPRGWLAVRKNPIQLSLAVATMVCGAVICVAGMYAMMKGIIVAYQEGEVTAPFSC